MESSQLVLRRVTWAHVVDRRACFMRKKGAPKFFDPGCWVEEDKDERITLQEKIFEDLGVKLDLSEMRKLTSFKAQAYDKPDDTMVPFAYYMAPYRGELQLSEEYEEVRFFSYEEKDHPDLTNASQGLLQYLHEKEGLI